MHLDPTQKVAVQSRPSRRQALRLVLGGAIITIAGAFGGRAAFTLTSPPSSTDTPPTDLPSVPALPKPDAVVGQTPAAVVIAPTVVPTPVHTPVPSVTPVLARTPAQPPNPSIVKARNITVALYPVVTQPKGSELKEKVTVLVVKGPLGDVANYAGHKLPSGLPPAALNEIVVMQRILVGGSGAPLPTIFVYNKGPTATLGLTAGTGTKDPRGIPRRLDSGFWAYDAQIIKIDTLPPGDWPLSVSMSTDGKVSETVATGLYLVVRPGVETSISLDPVSRAAPALTDGFSLS